MRFHLVRRATAFVFAHGRLEWVALCAIILGCSACHRSVDEDYATGAGQQRLSSEGVRRELFGNTARGMVFAGDRLRFYESYGSDLMLRRRSGYTFESARTAPTRMGTLRILADGTLCTRAEESQEICERLYVARGKFFAYGESGALTRTFRVEPGNPIGM